MAIFSSLVYFNQSDSTAVKEISGKMWFGFLDFPLLTTGSPFKNHSLCLAKLLPHPQFPWAFQDGALKAPWAVEEPSVHQNGFC